MLWTYSDGGRKAAGFQGDAGDCVCRAIAIAAGKPYREVYNRLAQLNKEAGGKKSARDGVPRKVYDQYFLELGGVWTPTMRVGQGCKVHLRKSELPEGRLVCRCSGHMVAVIDGVAYDTHDPRRGGDRCVYGYWTLPAPAFHQCMAVTARGTQCLNHAQPECMYCTAHSKKVVDSCLHGGV